MMTESESCSLHKQTKLSKNPSEASDETSLPDITEARYPL